MPTLLYIPSAHRDDGAVLFPWQQSLPLRARLDAHVAACAKCVAHHAAILSGGTVFRTTFYVGCPEGEEIADLMAGARPPR
jgi:hypothetical protein